MAKKLYHVEYILSKRYVDGIPEYLTKWRDYTDDDNTWEPEESFKLCPWVVTQFEDINKKVTYPHITAKEAKY